MNTDEMMQVIWSPPLEATHKVMRVAVKLSRKARKMEKKWSTSKKYLGHTTPQQPSVLRKARDCFSKQSNGHHEA